ncbi:hypothetical protein F5X68DRAFT_77914 [Plectosphaerella plurivora]|uniref:Uncharacterized protein n=1 Tax=Plectosphaerella plurivora TaxID=936078 RepID=A0A9P8VD87_9PEZI|nr:hypothetical protein F5X68DRAFT_77914 [Plectosphaerella plurivora]
MEVTVTPVGPFNRLLPPPKDQVHARCYHTLWLACLHLSAPPALAPGLSRFAWQGRAGHRRTSITGRQVTQGEGKRAGFFDLATDGRLEKSALHCDPRWPCRVPCSSTHVPPAPSHLAFLPRHSSSPPAPKTANDMSRWRHLRCMHALKTRWHTLFCPLQRSSAAQRRGMPLWMPPLVRQPAATKQPPPLFSPRLHDHQEVSSPSAASRLPGQ